MLGKKAVLIPTMSEVSHTKSLLQPLSKERDMLSPNTTTVGKTHVSCVVLDHRSSEWVFEDIN